MAGPVELGSIEFVESVESIEFVEFIRFTKLESVSVDESGYGGCYGKRKQAFPG